MTVDREVLDLFFNGRDGYRGRYWQGIEQGEAANMLLVERLRERLLEFLQPRLSRWRTMTEARARASLSSVHAKLWVGNQEANGYRGTYDAGAHLQVARWEETRGSGGRWAETAQHGRWAPHGRVLVVNGAWIDPEGREHVTEGKVDRSSQIHLAGCT